MQLDLCKEKEWSCLNETRTRFILSSQSPSKERVGGSQKGKDIGHNLSKLIDKSHRKERDPFQFYAKSRRVIINGRPSLATGLTIDLSVRRVNRATKRELWPRGTFKKCLLIKDSPRTYRPKAQNLSKEHFFIYLLLFYLFIYNFIYF